MGGIVRGENGILIAIGGTPDYVHLLATFHPTSCVTDMLRRIKANSSKWLHENSHGMQAFAWQSGYAAFTVSQSILGDVEAYVLNQQTHHANLSFEDEFLAFLQRHGIQYDERHVLGWPSQSVAPPGLKCVNQSLTTGSRPWLSACAPTG